MYRQLIDKIKEYNTIIIHRHKYPDGDALGSQIGLKEIIIKNFPDKRVLICGDENPNLNFLGKMDDVIAKDYDGSLVIVVDTGSHYLISDERYKLGEYIIKIDHHASGNNYANLNIVDEKEISCASLITKICLTENLALTKMAAQALFTGIVTDSNRFKYNGVNSSTFFYASKLTEFAFSIDEVYQKIYIEDFSNILLRARLIEEIKFPVTNLAYLYTNYQFALDNKVTPVFLSKNMIGIMEGIKEIDIWVNFTEDEEGHILTEIRSYKYDINKVAVKYGGGGHRLASGAYLNSTTEMNKMIRDLEKVLEG